MRIRRCASRLLGSACVTAPPDPAPRFEPQLPLPPPPPPPPPPRPSPSAAESHGGEGGFADTTSSGQPPCELNLSPWDLTPQLDPSDAQAQAEFDEAYMYFISFRASWAVSTSWPAASVKEEQEEMVAKVDGVRLKPRDKAAQKMKKAVVKKMKKEKENKECELKKKAKPEEGDGGVAAGEAQMMWTCKKNDGKRWSCHRLVRQPNSLCLHHSDKNRVCNNLVSESMSTVAPPAAVAPAVSKLSTSSKPRRKRPVVDIGEGFYYYAGFGPSSSKRQCLSSSMQQQEFPAPAEQNDAREDHSAAPTADQAQAVDFAYHQAAAQPICDDDMARIAGGDEESSDGEPRVVGVNGDSKRKSPLKKRWRKPVKARSLKSLM